MPLASDTNDFCLLLNQHFNPDEFTRLVAFVGQDITEYTSLQKPRPNVILDVVAASQRQGWYEELIQAAAFERPKIPALTSLAENRPARPDTQVQPRFLLPSEVRSVHEIVVKRQNAWIDPAMLRFKLAEIEPRVCSIVIDTDQGDLAYGTGFLLGPDVMMTNYHVVEPIIKGATGQTTAKGVSAKRANVKCLFDYKYDGGDGPKPGSQCGFAEKWLLDFSADHLLKTTPPPDALDYALVRLDRKPGEDKIEMYPGAQPVLRGWLTPEPNYSLPVDSSLVILQHPNGYPLKLALDAAAVVALNENRTRVTYSTNTEGGSSGSPCFNLNLQLVALHHSGDQSDPENKINEGIPFKAIMALLERHDSAKLLAPAVVRLAPAKSGVMDCFKTYVMRGGRVFLGRDNFRSELRQLGVDQRSRVLAITGDPQTGKSYSEDFIRHVHACSLPSLKQKLISRDVDLDESSPQEFISFLVKDLGVAELPPNPRPDASRWVRQRLVPVIQEAVERNDKIDIWWILLDGFRSDAYPEGLESFVSELSRAIDDDLLLPRLRLVLINYRKPPAKMRKDVAQGITLKDILEFFKHANEAEGKPHSEDTLEKEALQDIAGAQADCADPRRSQDYLRTLSDKVTESARKLFPIWMKA